MLQRDHDAEQQLMTVLSPLGRPQQHPAGYRFYEPQQSADRLLLLLDGLVRVYTLSPEGRALTLFLHRAPALFGELALLGTPRHDAFAEAFSAVTVVSVPREQVRALMQRNSEVGLTLLDLLGRRLRAMELKLAEIAFKSVPQRLAGLLVALAQEERRDDGSASVLRLTHQQLAEMIGTYRETVTKALGDLREAGLVRIEDEAICLLDLDQLRRVAEERLSRAG